MLIRFGNLRKNQFFEGESVVLALNKPVASIAYRRVVRMDFAKVLLTALCSDSSCKRTTVEIVDMV